MSENIELCVKLFVSWNFSRSRAMELDADYNNQSFIAKIIRKKIEVFEIPIQVPDYLLMLIEICTGSNPGISQIMLKSIMEKIPDIQPNHVITPEDFSRAYVTEFPIIEESTKWEDHFRKLWDSQKDENGNNLCDTKDWWMKVFES